MGVREKLVERLRDLAGVTPPICDHQKPEEIDLFGKNVTVYCKPFEQFQGLMREAADYIDHGATVQEWISVKDRLPEENTAVLTYRESGIEVEFRWHRGWDNDEFTPCPVTHWMPLPEPPKGE